MQVNIAYQDGTHAGALDDETLDEIWDHLDGIDPPTLSDATIGFLTAYNGVVPRDTYVDGLRIARFLNFCNDYDPANSKIAQWHVVRNRRWIADRLDPMILPIAELAHGDYMCLDFADRSEPRVIRWVHENSTPGKPCYLSIADDLIVLAGHLSTNGRKMGEQ